MTGMIATGEAALIGTVAHHHILRGNARSCGLCPIALALNEQHPRQGGWRVTNDHACYPYGGGLMQIPLPSSCIDFIQAFDSGAHVEPFTFQLQVRE
jgi:hypothetical protein